MSDTPIPGRLSSTGLASAAEFDARLRRTDENRWLASRYAPEAGRERLVAIYLLHQELQRALQASEPMIGKIRIQWWRETLEGLGAGKPRRHDLTEELARVTAGREDLLPAMQELVDRYDDVVDDHLHEGGHGASTAHLEKHLAAEGALMRLAGLALRAGLGNGELEALSRCGAAHLAVTAKLKDAAERWKDAQGAARKLPHEVWPAIAHLAAANDPYRLEDDPKRRDKAPLLKRWRVLSAMFSRRL